MFTSFETQKTLTAIVCTILFSATCVLSAVGPAQAVATSHVPAARPLA